LKDDLTYRFLKRLAETLDISKTMEDFPEMRRQDIQPFLLKLADTFKTSGHTSTNTHLIVDSRMVNIYVDGASRGNPGDAGIGVVIATGSGKILKEIEKYLGKATNNVAEYQALIVALKEAKLLGVEAIKIFADSELMVKQIKGEYKVKSVGLLPLYREAKALLIEFSRYDIIHINREKNTEADRLANQAIDSKVR
jgi:ribonuclease HI